MKVSTLVSALEEVGPAPDLAVVLGSGLSALVGPFEPVAEVRYSDLPYLPATTVTGHPGKLLLRKGFGLSIAFLAGRTHIYEGRSANEVVRAVRGIAMWGCRTFVLTNAAGAIGHHQLPGSLMMLSDHLNLTGLSPLSGPNHGAWGPRFPDMSEVYDAELRTEVMKRAAEEGIELTSGVYAGVPGPEYETPAQIRMLRQMGADAVGMSTVLEAIALKHLGVRLLGISCITNRAAGLSDTVLRHEDVQAAARGAQDTLSRLLMIAADAASRQLIG
ncbi:MAG: purine-nucleoside phosphorylase [Myxococcota bacterium]